MKMSRGGYKIHVRKAEDEDHTLEELYNQSEFAKEKATAKEKDENVNDDIAEFLDAENSELDETELKEKKSSKKARQKREKREKTKHSAGKIISIIILALLIISGGTFGVLAFFTANHGEESSDFAYDDAESDKIYYSPLTGLEVSDPNLLKAATTCVMIENSPDARPQSGLDQAGVIYEAIAEGGITRFMAIYQEAKPELIGPVRSVRLTYAEMAKPYKCSIAHVGGAQNALNLIRNNSEFRDIDQFFNGNYYWRANTKPNGKRIYAPHNVYTDATHLDSLNYKKGYTESTFTGFTRLDPDAIQEPVEQNATTVRINISSALYNPIFTYDANTNSYKRAHTSGGPHYSLHKDGSQVQISPKVVIAMKTTPVARGDGYMDYKTTGGGDAFIFQNGTVIAAKWQRNDVNSPLRFIDNEGNDINLVRGQVWVSIYPSNSDSVNWN